MLSVCSCLFVWHANSSLEIWPQKANHAKWTCLGWNWTRWIMVLKCDILHACWQVFPLLLSRFLKAKLSIRFRLVLFWCFEIQCVKALICFMDLIHDDTWMYCVFVHINFFLRGQLPRKEGQARGIEVILQLSMKFITNPHCYFVSQSVLQAFCWQSRHKSCTRYLEYQLQLCHATYCCFMIKCSLLLPSDLDGDICPVLSFFGYSCQWCILSWICLCLKQSTAHCTTLLQCHVYRFLKIAFSLSSSAFHFRDYFSLLQFFAKSTWVQLCYPAVICMVLLQMND